MTKFNTKTKKNGGRNNANLSWNTWLKIMNAICNIFSNNCSDLEKNEINPFSIESKKIISGIKPKYFKKNPPYFYGGGYVSLLILLP